MNEFNELEIRKATLEDNLEEIAELIYNTDPFIYPYWFETLEKCKEELPPLIKEEKFIFNYKNLYVTIDKLTKKIIGVLCIIDKNIDLSYDYSILEAKNERYKFTINNYVKGLIKEVKEAKFAYISNVCVHEEARGKKVGNKMLDVVINDYKMKKFDEIALDVLAEINPGAVHLYEKKGFEKSSDIFEGFSGPLKEKPAVFSMNLNLNDKKRK